MQSHIVLKADGVERGILGEVEKRLTDHGLVVEGIRWFRLRSADVHDWSPMSEHSPQKDELVAYLTEPMILVAVRGRRSVEITGEIKRAIRAKYGLTGMRNMLHTPNDTGEAARERVIFEARSWPTASSA